VLAFAVLVWVVGVAAVLVGGVRSARHRAETAADIAALAGAARVADGGGAACARAKEIAVESRARILRCRVRGEVVDVSVAVDITMPMGLKGRRIVSRAYPSATCLVALSVNRGWEVAGSENTFLFVILL
jgi:secretion/DNA translocation related TadE-like protein